MQEDGWKSVLKETGVSNYLTQNAVLEKLNVQFILITAF